MRIKSIKFSKEKNVFKAINYLSNGIKVIHHYPTGIEAYRKLQAKAIAKVLRETLSPEEIEALIQEHNRRKNDELII